MNIRRINAAKNFSTGLKFVLVLLAIIFILVFSTIKNINKQDKITSKSWKFLETTEYYNLTNFTCNEIYDRQLNGTLYKDNKDEPFDSTTVLMYYIKNCKSLKV